MKRELRSAGKFDRKLASLFESLEGREKELQGRLDELVKGLLDGTISKAPQHHPTDDTCCLPLIGSYVVVFRPNHASSEEKDQSGRTTINFKTATHFDLLNIEDEQE